jgi:hypothetical protein
MRRFLQLALLVSCAPALAGQGSSARVEEAATAYEQLEFERCLELTAELPGDDADPPTAARAWLYRGLCHFDLAQTALAAADFLAALRLSPEASLPAGVSPKVGELFEAVKSELVRDGARPPVLTPTQAPASVSAALFPKGPARAERSRVGPFVTGGVGLAALAVAGAFGVQAKVSERAANAAAFTSDAHRLAGRAQLSATVANVAWICSGVALAVAAGWYGLGR